MRALACVFAGLAALSTASARAETRVVKVDARGYFDVGGGALVPRGDFARQASASPSWSFQFGIGPKRLPFTFGLGAGAVLTASRTDAGPSGVWVQGDGGVDFGPTTVTRSTELRHLEAIVRLEPDWPRVRPFLEATAGVVQYWTTTTMRASWTGGVLDDGEQANDYAPAFGLGGGLILSPFRPMHVAPQADGTGAGELAFALTLGVRVVRGGNIAGASPATSDGASTALAQTPAALDAFAPYALLTLAFRSADAAVRQ